MNSLLKLAKEIRQIAYELEVFGVEQDATEKQATVNRLYEYEINGVTFFMDKKMSGGVRLPNGKARWTKNFYPVSGALNKALDE